VRVGEALGRYSYKEELEAGGEGGGGGGGAARRQQESPQDGDGGAAWQADPPEAAVGGASPPPGGVDDAGSCMIVLATDAPLSARNLERLARRAVLGLARTGSFMDNGSGDFVIAFSTRNLVPYAPAEKVRTVEDLHDDALGPLFLAAVESVEEAIYNSLLAATTTTGYRGRTVEAIPVDPLRKLLSKRPGTVVKRGKR
jgi:L-aminopeptidase/D-esterase-like protein